MSESSLRVIVLPSLVYPCLENYLTLKKMKYAKPCYSSKKVNGSNDFASFCLFLVFWSNFHRGRLLDRERFFFFREGRLM